MKPNPNHRGDPTFIPDLFKHFGIPLTIMQGAMQWGMGDFGYIQGVFWHHTGSRTTPAWYIKNNPNLSNALSSLFHVNPKGHHTLCGIGIAWHAGRGSGHGWKTNDANSASLGWEIQANGTDAWDEEQLYWVRRGTAVVLWYLGHDATIDHMISHWEYSLRAQGKWDPGAGDGISGHVMDMDPERKKVQAYINNIRKYGTLDVPEEDDFMSALSHEEQRELLENSRLISRVHHELTHEFQSLVEDENGKRSQWKGTLVGMMLQVDKKVEAMHAHMLPGVITKIQELFKKETPNNG